MCGIIGFFSRNSRDLEKYTKLINIIKYRGPDNQQIKLEKDNFFFGHARLSIIDLEPQANQPMLSHNGRFIITFNGEIYNYKLIKQEIETEKNKLGIKIEWKTKSDTEVLIEAIETWGLEKTLYKAKGMFAFALYDKRNSNLFLVRDRFGEKPLYFGWLDDSFFFSSDLNPIKQFKPLINKKALGLYFRFMYIPTPFSIYENVYKLPQGSFVKFNLKNIHNRITNFDTIKKSKSGIFFKKWFTPSSPEQYNFKKENNLTDQLETILTNSVRENMVSDAPIGCFLSGGIDSSLISILMQKCSSVPINTFSIEQENVDFNEGDYARKISSIIGSTHHSFKINYNDIKKYFSIAPTAYSEPFADSSQIPSLILSEHASKLVKVCLTGDAGDELFAGYNRHIYSPKIWFYLRLINKDINKVLLNIFEKKFFKSILPKSVSNKIFPNVIDLENKIIRTLNKTINSKNFSDYFLSVVTETDEPSIFRNQTIIDKEINNFKKKFLEINSKKSVLDTMCLFDTENYLSDDILCKVDRASMFNSLETRVPFLSEDVYKFAFGLNKNKKISKGRGKMILRDILKKYLPNDLINRKKMGFSIPINSILKKDLNKEVKEVIFDQVKNFSDDLNIDNIYKIWNEFLDSKDHSYRIYALYNFFKWKNY